MIVADTGAILALIDKSDLHHAALTELYQEAPHRWVLPWAILPEVDYLVGAHLGPRAEEAFLADLADDVFLVEWGREADLARAHALTRQYRALKLGLVDGIVMAMAERLRAAAIATLDVRHFGAVTIKGGPALWPRDGDARKLRRKRLES
ncbi:MAG: PIN domain-containing protein [Acidobacteriota bacterium]